jgi:hypothetical protein
MSIFGTLTFEQLEEPHLRVRTCVRKLESELPKTRCTDRDEQRLDRFLAALERVDAGEHEILAGKLARKARCREQTHAKTVAQRRCPA